LRAAYENSDNVKAMRAAYRAANKNSDHGKAKNDAYNKTRREKRRAAAALKRAAT
jgi:hypothetical protein